MLTGNPRINGVLIPQPQYEGDGDGRWAWTSNHTWFDGREGKILRSLRFGGEITFGWQHLETPAFNKIIAALALETPVRFVPATVRAGDPNAEENEYLCELTSPLPVYGAGDVATNLHSLSVTLKTTRTRESRDGISTSALDYAFEFGEDVDLLGGVQGTLDAETGLYTWDVSISGYAGRILRVKPQGDTDVKVRFLNDAGQYVGETILGRERATESGVFYVEVPGEGAITLPPAPTPPPEPEPEPEPEPPPPEPPSNNPPRIAGLPDLTLAPGQDTASVNLADYSSDADGDPLAWRIEERPNTSVATASISGSSLTATRVGPGSTEVTVAVSDGTVQDTATLSIVVEEAAKPVAFALSVSPTTITAGESVTATVEGGSGEVVYRDADTKARLASSTDSESGYAATIPYDDPGTYSVEAVSEGTVSDPVQITVEEVNEGPPPPDVNIITGSKAANASPPPPDVNIITN